MHYVNVTAICTLALALSAGACNRGTGESPDTTAREQSAADADRVAELERERNEEIVRLNERAVELEREYGEANQEVVRGNRTATAGLREELKEDVANVKQAISELQTTTPENWWDRHERAMARTADDVEADVRRLAGSVAPARPPAATGTTGEHVSTAPFTSRRDAFTADLRARVDAMQRALDGVKTRGAQETEVEDARARVRKLGDDVDRLRSASADDWWDVTKARVTEYLERVEGSVKRLDDNRS
jgi:hypothetical protein